MDAASLAALIAAHQPCVALTGAGVSTESGVPDFRSPTGIWARFDPMEYGTIEAFRADPEKVWRFYAPRFSMLTAAEPNAAHRALAELERLGLLEAVVTQNIDLLHERAGSRRVLEVHGSIRTSTCPACRRRFPLADVQLLIERHGAPPCPECGEVLKPDVVFFGEAMPAAAIAEAFELARRAKLLLVVGSSLEVVPVALLPGETAAAGGLVAIVNRGPTAYDGRAALRVDGSAGEVLARAVAELRPSP
jgi:NAD-dependent deacetylase